MYGMYVATGLVNHLKVIWVRLHRTCGLIQLLVLMFDRDIMWVLSPIFNIIFALIHKIKLKFYTLELPSATWDQNSLIMLSRDLPTPTHFTIKERRECKTVKISEPTDNSAIPCQFTQYFKTSPPSFSSGR